MGMDRLIESLREEARERAEEILAEAREEAERVRAEGREELRDLKARRLEDVEEQARAEGEAEVAAARREAAAARLEARDRGLERVFGRVEACLSGAEETEAYRRLAAADLLRARGYLGGREASLRCRPEAAEALGALAREAGLQLAVEPTPGAAPGFRIAAEGEGLEVDATLPTWLERLRPELAIYLAGRLLP